MASETGPSPFDLTRNPEKGSEPPAMGSAGQSPSTPDASLYAGARRDDAARARAARWSLKLDALSRSPHQFDFFQAMRRLEAAHRDSPDDPRFGAGLRPADEPLRLGQDPSLSFPASSLAAMAASAEGPPRLLVNFFGLLGPNGPLPLHLTEYTRDRQRNADDPTMARFLDLFHHRMLMFFYRAWASGQPTVNRDLPASDRFELYVGALVALGLSSLRQRDAFPDLAKLHYAGRLAPHHRNGEGLAAMAGDFFGVPARVQSFMGEWIDLPADRRWRLGADTGVGRLGLSSMLGARTWTRQQKFRLVLGPLDRGKFQSLLPGGTSLPKLAAMVRTYVGDELHWDLRLILEEKVEEPFRLGQSRLSWTAWLGRAVDARREDLVLDPQAEVAQSVS
jgi:type VI secretion system protein ImpH